MSEKNISNGDKSNKWVETLDIALKSLGKDLTQLKLKLYWSGYFDLYFKGTEDYIRYKEL